MSDSNYVPGTQFFHSLKELSGDPSPSSPYQFAESIPNLPATVQIAFAKLGSNLAKAGKTFEQAEQELSGSSAVERMSNYGTERQNMSAGYLFDPHAGHPDTGAERRKVLDRMIGY